MTPENIWEVGYDSTQKCGRWEMTPKIWEMMSPKMWVMGENPQKHVGYGGRHPETCGIWEMKTPYRTAPLNIPTNTAKPSQQTNSRPDKPSTSVKQFKHITCFKLMTLLQAYSIMACHKCLAAAVMYGKHNNTSPDTAYNYMYRII